jgi:hypothetical protein
MKRSVTMAVVREVVSTGETQHREHMCEQCLSLLLLMSTRASERKTLEWPNQLSS